MSPKPRVLLVSIVPPQNDCGVRIVMHRHLVERNPFDLHVATNTPQAWNPELKVTLLDLPYPLQRIRKSRYAPRFEKWFADYWNFVVPEMPHRGLDDCIWAFKPDVILTLAETGLCHLAAKTAKRNRIPLAGLFLDWFPIMPPHFGHSFAKGILSERYRRLYRECDLAFCTSDGMQDVLGPHPNSHVIYPMPGKHFIPEKIHPPKNERFRLVYVGAAERFYGRMLRRLIKEMEKCADLEILIVGPHNDWPDKEKENARAKGICLGFMPPEKAAEVLAGADALLVVMSFEEDQKLFMRTSFTTKFLDYAAFGKPVILWGPDYCTPSRLATREDAAIVVNDPLPSAIVSAALKLKNTPTDVEKYSSASRRLQQTTFSPECLQNIFVTEMEKLVPPASE